MEAQAVSQDSSKLLDRLGAEIRVRHYSIRAEEAYGDWVRRFILFHSEIGVSVTFFSSQSPLAIRGNSSKGDIQKYAISTV